MDPIVDDAEWKRTPEALSNTGCYATKGNRARVQQRAETTRNAEARFRCAGCGQPLFTSDAKFESGTGWPRLSRAAARRGRGPSADFHLILPRTEYHCSPMRRPFRGTYSMTARRPTGKRFLQQRLVALSFRTRHSARADDCKKRKSSRPPDRARDDDHQLADRSLNLAQADQARIALPPGGAEKTRDTPPAFFRVDVVAPAAGREPRAAGCASQIRSRIRSFAFGVHAAHPARRRAAARWRGQFCHGAQRIGQPLRLTRQGDRARPDPRPAAIRATTNGRPPIGIRIAGQVGPDRRAWQMSCTVTTRLRFVVPTAPARGRAARRPPEDGAASLKSIRRIANPDHPDPVTSATIARQTEAAHFRRRRRAKVARDEKTPDFRTAARSDPERVGQLIAQMRLPGGKRQPCVDCRSGGPVGRFAARCGRAKQIASTPARDLLQQQLDSAPRRRFPARARMPCRVPARRRSATGPPRQAAAASRPRFFSPNPGAAVRMLPRQGARAGRLTAAKRAASSEVVQIENRRAGSNPGKHPKVVQVAGPRHTQADGRRRNRRQVQFARAPGWPNPRRKANRSAAIASELSRQQLRIATPVHRHDRNRSDPARLAWDLIVSDGFSVSVRVGPAGGSIRTISHFAPRFEQSPRTAGKNGLPDWPGPNIHTRPKRRSGQVVDGAQAGRSAAPSNGRLAFQAQQHSDIDRVAIARVRARACSNHRRNSGTLESGRCSNTAPVSACPRRSRSRSRGLAPPSLRRYLIQRLPPPTSSSRRAVRAPR